jgi:glutaredoxin
MPKLTLYTRQGCHLCEDAKAALLELKNEWDFSFEEVDIESSDELTEQYGLMIPVVHMDGEMVAYGIVNQFDIKERLHEKKLSSTS